MFCESKSFRGGTSDEGTTPVQAANHRGLQTKFWTSLPGDDQRCKPPERICPFRDQGKLVDVRVRHRSDHGFFVPSSMFKVMKTRMDYQGKRVTVMGLGGFGGGVGAIQFLAAQGAQVTIADLRSQTELAESLAAIRDLPISAVHLGEHRAADFSNAELIVASPAVPRTNRFLEIGRDAGAVVTSEMNLFWKHNRGKVVAVTGSNGKSTTAALIHALLTAAGRRCHLGGNIGHSLLPLVSEIAGDDIVVLELSSFQLEDLAPLHPQPDIAVVTNFTPNHLDRHGTLEAYRHAKQNIVAWQRSDQLAILNADDADVMQWPTAARRMMVSAQRHDSPGIYRDGDDAVYFDGCAAQRFPLAQWLPLPGAHNFQNALAAAGCAISLGASLTAVEAGLKSFQALPHRLQLVAEIDGRQFYDDSIATTPESVAAALQAFTAPIILLAGGYDKGIDLTDFARLIGTRCKAIALLGQTGEQLQTCLQAEGSAADFQRCGNLEEAVRWCHARATQGDVVLLSPGCASYDWFRDFRERGHAFSSLVNSHPGCKAG